MVNEKINFIKLFFDFDGFKFWIETTAAPENCYLSSLQNDTYKKRVLSWFGNNPSEKNLNRIKITNFEILEKL